MAEISQRNVRNKGMRVKKYIVGTFEGIDQFVQTLGAFNDGVFHSVMTPVNELLDADEVVKDAYHRGLEDGKAVNGKGCVGCKFEGNGKDHSPCDYCCNCYSNQWQAKQTDDEIKVGDVVTIKDSDKHSFVVTKVSNQSVWGVDEDGSWNYWAKDEVTKTDKHFDIDKILMEIKGGNDK